VTDYAIFITEDVPKMTGPMPPPIPAGHDYDFINADAILNRLTVLDGRLVLPSGSSYAALILPESPTMRPAVAQKIQELARDGAKIIGAKPTRSPSLQNYPACDAQTRRFATWDALPDAAALAVPPDVIAPPDILWTHRRTPGADIYFLSNQSDREREETLSFRVNGRPASLWNPVSAGIQTIEHTEDGSRSSINLRLPPLGSVFVVFGSSAPASQTAGIARGCEIPLTGPWSVEFPSGKITMTDLVCWTTLEKDEFRHHSGAAVYSTEVEIAEPRGRMILNLGRVESLATVTLNGKSYPTLWTYPYQLDVTDAVKPGRNELKVEIINSWNNRLAGDAGLPKEKRRSTVTDDPFKPGAALRPAGLLGPVRLWINGPG